MGKPMYNYIQLYNESKIDDAWANLCITTYNYIMKVKLMMRGQTYV